MGQSRSQRRVQWFRRLAAFEDVVELRGQARLVGHAERQLVAIQTAKHALELPGQRMVSRARLVSGVGVHRGQVQVARDVVHLPRGEAAPLALFPTRELPGGDGCVRREQRAPEFRIDRIEQRLAGDFAGLI
jgi:hypothetical protein